MVEGTSQAVLGSFDQRKLTASLSLFLKSEKSELSFTKEKDLSTGPSMIFDMFPGLIGFRRSSQITEGPVLMPVP